MFLIVSNIKYSKGDACYFYKTKNLGELEYKKVKI